MKYRFTMKIAYKTDDGSIDKQYSFKGDHTYKSELKCLMDIKSSLNDMINNLKKREEEALGH